MYFIMDFSFYFISFCYVFCSVFYTFHRFFVKRSIHCFKHVVIPIHPQPTKQAHNTSNNTSEHPTLFHSLSPHSIPFPSIQPHLTPSPSLPPPPGGVRAAGPSSWCAAASRVHRTGSAGRARRVGRTSPGYGCEHTLKAQGGQRNHQVTEQQ